MFTASRDRLIKMWDLNYETNKASLKANLDSHTDWVNQIIMIPESRNTLVSCSNDTTIKVWRLDGLDKYSQSKQVKPFSTLDDHTDYVRSIDFHPASGKLYSASDDGELKVWDLNCEKMLQKYLVYDKEKKPFD